MLYSPDTFFLRGRILLLLPSTTTICLIGVLSMQHMLTPGTVHTCLCVCLRSDRAILPPSPFCDLCPSGCVRHAFYVSIPSLLPCSIFDFIHGWTIVQRCLTKSKIPAGYECCCPLSSLVLLIGLQVNGGWGWEKFNVSTHSLPMIQQYIIHVIQ